MLKEVFNSLSLMGGLTLSLLGGLITLRTVMALRQYPDPQAILILDGNDQRVQQGADFAEQYPDLPIWISGYCSQRPEVLTTFIDAKVNDRVNYDLRATDTVTHFTTLVDDFANQNIHHVYLATSDYHMSRARAIATIIFGHHGIAIAPISLHSKSQPPEESWLKIIRDGGRSLIWLATDRSGARFNGRNKDQC